jgi:hypothetical protein
MREIPAVREPAYRVLGIFQLKQSGSDSTKVGNFSFQIADDVECNADVVDEVDSSISSITLSAFGRWRKSIAS